MSASTEHAERLAPSPWIVRFAPLVSAGGRVLDVACGAGRHSRFFAARGCRVVAVDRDPEVIAALAGVAGVTPIAVDLETGRWHFGGQRFEAVVVTNYLHRALLSQLLNAVADDGVLIYETFAAGNETYGKPSNPDFLLTEGELLSVVRGTLTVVAFEQGAVIDDRPAVLQRLAAVGRQRQWPPLLPL